MAPYFERIRGYDQHDIQNLLGAIRSLEHGFGEDLVPLSAARPDDPQEARDDVVAEAFLGRNRRAAREDCVAVAALLGSRVNG